MGVLGSLFGTKSYRIYKGRVKLEGQVSGESGNAYSQSNTNHPNGSPSGRHESASPSNRTGHAGPPRGSKVSAWDLPFSRRGMRSSRLSSSVGERPGGDGAKVDESQHGADDVLALEPPLTSARTKHATLERFSSLGRITGPDTPAQGTIGVLRHG